MSTRRQGSLSKGLISHIAHSAHSSFLVIVIYCFISGRHGWILSKTCKNSNTSGYDYASHNVWHTWSSSDITSPSFLFSTIFQTTSISNLPNKLCFWRETGWSFALHHSRYSTRQAGNSNFDLLQVLYFYSIDLICGVLFWWRQIVEIWLYCIQLF